MATPTFPPTEVTNIRFIVNGLNRNPKYGDAARSLRLAGLPEIIGILQDRLLEEEVELHEETTFQIYAPQDGRNSTEVEDEDEEATREETVVMELGGKCKNN